jgi:dCMP deaminase
MRKNITHDIYFFKQVFFPGFMDQHEWDVYFLTRAFENALKSPDLSTQNGALVVNERFLIPSWLPWKYNVLGEACNTFPQGVRITNERLTKRPDKYDFTGHAEENSIVNARNRGYFDLHGAILYGTWVACGPCGRDIVNAGIKEVVDWKGVEKMIQETSRGEGMPDWQVSINNAFEMFEDAGIIYRRVECHIPIDAEILFSGKKFNIGKII